MEEIFEFESALDSAIKKSENLTDREIADRIADKCRMKGKEILKLFPDRNDLLQLLRVVEIVKADSDIKERGKKLHSNIADLSGIIVKVLDKLL